MKLYLSLLLTFYAYAPSIFAIDILPTRIESKKDKLTLYTDSKETEKMGYGNWNPYQDGEYLMIKTFIQEGDIVIDAGAHKGEWSNLVLEHTDNNCHLYSFEPVPNFFKTLTEEVGNRAECHNVALGKNETEVSMYYYYEESEGCSSLFERKVLNTIPVKRITVPVTYLDKFCSDNKIDHIDFLKIDTEGAEWDVLQGANELITHKKIPIIQFEYGGTYPDAHITLKQVYEYFTAKDYAIFRLTADGLIHVSQWREELEDFHLSNWLAVLNDDI